MMEDEQKQEKTETISNEKEVKTREFLPHEQMRRKIAGISYIKKEENEEQKWVVSSMSSSTLSVKWFIPSDEMKLLMKKMIIEDLNSRTWPYQSPKDARYVFTITYDRDDISFIEDESTIVYSIANKINGHLVHGKERIREHSKFVIIDCELLDFETKLNGIVDDLCFARAAKKCLFFIELKIDELKKKCYEQVGKDPDPCYYVLGAGTRIIVTRNADRLKRAICLGGVLSDVYIDSPYTLDVFYGEGADGRLLNLIRDLKRSYNWKASDSDIDLYGENNEDHMMVYFNDKALKDFIKTNGHQSMHKFKWLWSKDKGSNENTLNTHISKDK